LWTGVDYVLHTVLGYVGPTLAYGKA
jgi:hypothetical protein